MAGWGRRAAWAAIAGIVVSGSACEGARRRATTIDDPAAGLVGKPNVVDHEPCEEGETRECHVDLGVRSGIRSCAHGVQTCEGGRFGPCRGSFSGHEDVASKASSSSGHVSTKSLSTPRPCAGNPCDPGCVSFTETPDAGLAPVMTAGGSWTGGAVEHLPGGFQNKGLKDPDHPPTKEPCDGVEDCQFDHHCVAGKCVPWKPGETDPSCEGVDLTAGPTCSGVIPVCNRGNTTAPAGIEILVFAGNSQQLQDDLGLCGGFNSSSQSSCTTTEPIPPGQCISVTGCALGGTKSIVVNPPSPYGSKPPIEECHCGNDWTVYHNGGSCSSTSIELFEARTYAEQYVATCPSGSRPRWGFLTWDADLLANGSGPTRLLVRAHTARSPDAPASDCSDCVVVGDAPTTDPAACFAGGPGACPKVLAEALGARAFDDVLELVFELEPSPDRGLAPMLHRWEVTFTCVPME